MSKKKKKHKKNKKRSFKYIERTQKKPATASSVAKSTEKSSIEEAQTKNVDDSKPKEPAKLVKTDGQDFVKSDLRRTMVVSGLIIITLLALWFVFEHTGLGPYIYHQIKI
jgi:hypothetical protein